jgi:adenosyl cobinamide kinase/adenosyl cobinamide phosphate guanylyltransferase
MHAASARDMTLVFGGVRNGKSRHALQLAEIAAYLSGVRV